MLRKASRRSWSCRRPLDVAGNQSSMGMREAKNMGTVTTFEKNLPQKARTPPRRPRHIPGVVRPTIDRAVRLPIAQSHRDIGLPEETGAGPEHTGRDRAVDRGSIGLEGQHPGTLR